MAATILDPDCALVVVDLQEGARGADLAHPVGEIARCAGELASAFRSQGRPVILVNTSGGSPGRTETGSTIAERAPDFLEMMAELGPWPGDHIVTKRSWGAFTGTRLQTILREEGVSHVVICGVATSIAVESTARQAYANGFNVTLASDAMTDADPEAHRNSVERIFPRLGEVGATGEILAMVSRLPAP